MISLEPRGVRYSGIGLMVGAKCLDTLISAYALHRPLTTFGPNGELMVTEGNAIPAVVHATYGWAGLVALTIVALAMLFLVVELGAKVIRRKTHGDERRKNLLAIYGIGYWAPGVFWLWIGLYNGYLLTVIL